MEPVSLTVIAGVVAGLVYLYAISKAQSLQNHPCGLLLIVIAGFGFRLLLMIPDPLYEIDFYRYLWDGGVINAGVSPYGWSPESVLEGDAPDALTRLAAEAPEIVARINYPHLTTIYPSVAEAVFAVSHWLKPWDLSVWRLVVLAFDAATLGLICLLLRRVGKPAAWCLVYWWNPVVIVEFANAAHMDAILLPFLVGTVLLSLKSRAWLKTGGMVSLAFAVAVKLWPLVLAPLIARTTARPWHAVTGMSVFVLVVILLNWPFLEHAFREDAGVTAYTVSWERNAAIFHTLNNGLRTVLDAFGLYALDAGRICRALVTVMIGGVVIWQTFRPLANDNGEDLIRRIIIIVATLLVLGPTMYPWYFTWLVPFLTVTPNRALLTFSVVLPLYRLQFHPWFLDNPVIFQNYVVWLEQGPVVLLLLFGWCRTRRAVMP